MAQQSGTAGRYEGNGDMVNPVSRKSICFLTNAYPDFNTSYRGIFIKKMAASLSSAGYGINVVTPKIYRNSRYIDRGDGIYVYRFPFCSGNKLLIEYEKIPYVRMVIYFLTGFLFTLYALLRHKCDLIHTHWAIPTGVIGVLCGAVLRKPIVVTVHGSDFRLATKGSRLLKKLFLWVCQRANQITCVSDGLMRGLWEIGVSPEKISTFPMGTDQIFLDVGRSRKHVPNDRPFTVLSNRNLLPLYNVSLLIQSVPLVLAEEPNTRFLIAGDGKERDRLAQELKDLGVERSVHFLGAVKHESMPELLTQSDVFVSTSLSDGTSVSLIEAMASGTFPIVTDIPANVEWITDGENGFLVPANEKEELAKRIVIAMRNTALLKSGREKNLQIVEKRGMWSRTIETTKEIYEKLPCPDVNRDTVLSNAAVRIIGGSENRDHHSSVC